MSFFEKDTIVSGLGISRIGRKTGIPGLELTMEAVRAASNRDLFDERLPTVDDPTMYDDPHQQGHSCAGDAPGGRTPRNDR